jgi:hypothetical protein
LRLLMSPRVARLVDALRAATPARRHDPRDAVPDVVGEVAQRHRLTPDAAAYYLQLLALPDPTDRNVMGWTGWSAGALKALRAELVTAGLVVEAKRDRAGRGVFLPGGWLALRAPNLPLEGWKRELYGDTDLSSPVVLVLRPVPELFAVAWRRVLDGDQPAFDSLGEVR